MQNEWKQSLRTLCALVALALLVMVLPLRAAAQDDDDDPPGRAARLGYIEGSVSFQPAGESEWVEAMPNRPMTTGDQLWVDRDSRAEVELGSASVYLNGHTGFSFLNLDDRTIQIQLSSGAISLRVRRLDDADVVEVDTPNQAFSIFRPGRYRIEASEDGSYTVVTVREGEGESSGNDQSYTVHQGQRATFSGTDRLRADVEQAGEDLDDFDQWSFRRDRRFEDSPSARYVSRDVVGAEDLGDYGDWRPSPEYGAVWYPRVDAGWAPYHAGHWAWVDPWGWTWVDDAPWGYAPFHYGRWAFVEGRWGWVPGPIESRPVYAPALVVFVGGGGPGMGGNVAWFALGPREVYVPSYHVSAAYVNRVNISNTVVTQTTITNVYNTTVINTRNTTVVNVTYANRNVSGAVTAVPQQAFAGGQSVAHAAVPVTRQQLAAASISARVAVAPSRGAVVGVHVGAAVHVAAPPAAVMNRQVIARQAPPPAPVSFAVKQQALAAHPGQPVARQEMQRIRPANSGAQPMVRQVPASANAGRPGNSPAANRPQMNRPAMNQPAMNQPAVNRPSQMQQNAPVENARPAETPAARPGTANVGRPVNQPGNSPAANHPQPNQPAMNQPTMRQPAMSQPAVNRPSEPSRQVESPARNERPMNEHPAAVQPVSHTPAAPAAQPKAVEAARPQNPAPAAHPQQSAPQPAARPAQPAQHPQTQPAAKPQAADAKKHPNDPAKKP
ncbi:MAG TPA: DUF6600 domain-containing protein [Candidatus Sulfotelmatobacter sp.]|nr:DUF6600 domain-containing protein [Candidatus Sulfotelmatobacter sp.]